MIPGNKGIQQYLKLLQVRAQKGDKSAQLGHALALLKEKNKEAIPTLTTLIAQNHAEAHLAAHALYRYYKEDTAGQTDEKESAKWLAKYQEIVAPQKKESKKSALESDPATQTNGISLVKKPVLETKQTNPAKEKDPTADEAHATSAAHTNGIVPAKKPVLETKQTNPAKEKEPTADETHATSTTQTNGIVPAKKSVLETKQPTSAKEKDSAADEKIHSTLATHTNGVAPPPQIIESQVTQQSVTKEKDSSPDETHAASVPQANGIAPAKKALPAVSLQSAVPLPTSPIDVFLEQCVKEPLLLLNDLAKKDSFLIASYAYVTLPYPLRTIKSIFLKIRQELWSPDAKQINHEKLPSYQKVLEQIFSTPIVEAKTDASLLMREQATRFFEGEIFSAVAPRTAIAFQIIQSIDPQEPTNVLLWLMKQRHDIPWTSQMRISKETILLTKYVYSLLLIEAYALCKHTQNNIDVYNLASGLAPTAYLFFGAPDHNPFLESYFIQGFMNHIETVLQTNQLWPACDLKAILHIKQLFENAFLEMQKLSASREHHGSRKEKDALKDSTTALPSQESSNGVAGAAVSTPASVQSTQAEEREKEPALVAGISAPANETPEITSQTSLPAPKEKPELVTQASVHRSKTPEITVQASPQTPDEKSSLVAEVSVSRTKTPEIVVQATPQRLENKIDPLPQPSITPHAAIDPHLNYHLKKWKLSPSDAIRDLAVDIELALSGKNIKLLLKALSAEQLAEIAHHIKQDLWQITPEASEVKDVPQLKIEKLKLYRTKLRNALSSQPYKVLSEFINKGLFAAIFSYFTFQYRRLGLTEKQLTTFLDKEFAVDMRSPEDSFIDIGCCLLAVETLCLFKENHESISEEDCARYVLNSSSRHLLFEDDVELLEKILTNLASLTKFLERQKHVFPDFPPLPVHSAETTTSLSTSSSGSIVPEQKLTQEIHNALPMSEPTSHEMPALMLPAAQTTEYGYPMVPGYFLSGSMAPGPMNGTDSMTPAMTQGSMAESMSLMAAPEGSMAVDSMEIGAMSSGYLTAGLISHEIVQARLMAAAESAPAYAPPGLSFFPGTGAGYCPPYEGTSAEYAVYSQTASGYFPR